MESSDSHNIQKNRSNKNDTNIDEEVLKIFRKNTGKISSADFAKLRQRYDDIELVDKIQKAYLEKYASISRKAKRFAQLIREKYSNQQYPFHVLLEKARYFKNKHHLSEEEFNEFQRIYEQELVGIKSSEVLLPNTNMMKILGSINVDFQGFNVKLNDADYKCLQEILKLYAASKPLHAQVSLQSMQYTDMALEALTGTFNRELGQRPGDSIHPVLAALFLPKIPLLDSHFLLSNIAGIVKARYNGEALNNRADLELFDALTNDPNDIICDNRSSMMDLLNRSQIQNQLWNCVLNLRNGQYYNTIFRDFVSSVDMCRLNKQDNPDLIYGRYDGTIIKRLLSAFSFRPTVVATSPVYNIINTNPYQQNVRPVVSRIQMINIRLPTAKDAPTTSLSDAIDQQQFFIENGMMVPRNTSLIYSRDVLFFFVDRRTNLIPFNNLQPFNIDRLPISVSGFERINDAPVNFELEMKIRGDVYQIRSIVLAEVNKLIPEKNVVVGSSAIVMNHADLTKGVYSSECIMYDPINVLETELRTPIYSIGEKPGDGIGDFDFITLGRSRGIIYMYQLVVDNTKGEISY